MVAGGIVIVIGLGIVLVRALNIPRYSRNLTPNQRQERPL